jgi:hypothetical protein
MKRTITVGGQIAITIDENNRVLFIQFLSDNENASVLEQGSLTRGQLQILRNAEFDYVACKAPLRSRSTLLKKAAHGRLSATRDEAYQLTLKVFKREGLDVRETLLREATELINNVRL